MGISCNTGTTYSILSLLLLILVTIPSSQSYTPKDIVTKELLTKLCSQPTILNHSFCVRWLTADLGTTSISLLRLVKVAVNETLKFGLKNQILMRKSAIGSSGDKQLKTAYVSCAISYGIANKELTKAKELLIKSSFAFAYEAVYKALDYGYSCEDEFEGPSNEPELVRDHVDKFIQMSHISRAFAALLIPN